MKDPQTLTVGKFLQEERERKELSLEAVSKVTRISLKNLEALESDDFVALPAPIFIRSFLKTYASFLGVNPDKVIALYETQTGMIGISSQEGAPPEKGLPRALYFVGIPVLIIIILACGAFYWFSSPRKAPTASLPAQPPSPSKEVVPETLPSPAPAPQVALTPEAQKPPEKAPSPSSQVAPPSPPVPQSVPQPVPQPSPQPSGVSSGVVPAAASSAPPEEKQEKRHILRVQAREQTWIRVQADDQPEFEVLLEPKEKAVWTARREMKITLGNAGGVDLTFNGKKVRSPGESGKVVHLQFPPKSEKKEP